MDVLRRHPVAVRTTFGLSLVPTYALPPATLEPLLPHGFARDTCGRAHLAVRAGLGYGWHRGVRRSVACPA